ncbi:hypothetical protein BJ508DRAFT_418574 [Ascobolus immersus RN42]|uniref:DUF7580 domain-containing protein n=1 Tax=Ascobolus immersus RN42 TaxID=1160509 RepID=A0A3N4HRZ5_ASCIM|nr:hypothetical protein BJ508DRAFT_418574 [Ascobolus immersus RN42]
MEIVGVVLGVLPLLITGIEHRSKITVIFKWRSETKSLCRRLRHEHLRLKLNLQVLVSSDAASRAEIEAALKEGSSKFWDSERGRATLKRLGIAAHTYHEVVSDCEELIRAIWKKLDLNDEFYEAGDEYRDIEEVKKEFIASLKRAGGFRARPALKSLLRKNAIIDLIDNLRRNNDLLKEIQSGADQIEHNLSKSTIDTKDSENTPKCFTYFLKHLDTARTTAINMHRTLAQYIHCSRHTAHNLNLELSDPNDEWSKLVKGRKRYARPSWGDVEMQFKLLVFAASAPYSGKRECQLAEMKRVREAFISAGEIEGLSEVNYSSCGTRGGVSKHDPAPADGIRSIPTAQRCSTSNDNPNARGVHFSDPPTPSPKATLSVAWTLAQNLCTPVCHCIDQKIVCFHFRLHQDSSLLLHNPSYNEAASMVSSPVGKLVSLHELIRQNSSESGGLSRRKRLAFAARISCSLLQLHSSPWINESRWSARTVFVGLDQDGKEVVSGPYLSQPFSQNLLNAGIEDSSGRILLPTTQSWPKISPVLLTLGVLLLELAMGNPIEQLAANQSDITSNPLSLHVLWRAAIEVLKSEQFGEAISDTYYKATQKCIDSSFTADSFHFSDEAFQLEYCRDVVAPIMNEYCTFVGNEPFLDSRR